MKLVIAEKPSVAQSLAKVLGAKEHHEGYLEGNGYLVSWCMGHLVELSPPEAYDERFSKWRYEDLPILPKGWKYEILPGTKKQFNVLKNLMNRSDVTDVINGCEVGREEGREEDREATFLILRSKGYSEDEAQAFLRSVDELIKQGLPE